MNRFLEHLQQQTRRHFFQQSAAGLGGIALNSLLAGEGNGAERTAANPLAPQQPHFPAKAKRVIYLHMTGSPPSLDLFDRKPELVKRNAEDCPDQFLAGRKFA
ncbi:MAG: DUF1501 domain-containing protein, partial [Planctomycetaceae bacterium]|nr:DUF1501 domain-containing protein [Planctomycetaceae bacterium]